MPAFLADGKGDEPTSVAPELPGKAGRTEFRPRHLGMRQLVVENTTQSSVRVVFHYSSQRMSKWTSSVVSPSDELIDEIIAADG